MNRHDYLERWWKAMDRAEQLGLVPERVNDHTYRVRSTSDPALMHEVTLDVAGRINGCSDCKGAEIFFNALHDGILKTPCSHMGSVARRELDERGIALRRRVSPQVRIA